MTCDHGLNPTAKVTLIIEPENILRGKQPTKIIRMMLFATCISQGWGSTQLQLLLHLSYLPSWAAIVNRRSKSLNKLEMRYLWQELLLKLAGSGH